MTRAENFFTRDFDSGVNPLVFTMIFMAVVGSLFLAWQGVTAGIVYTLMFSVVIGIFVLLSQSVKDDDSLKPISNYIRNPISPDLTISGFMWLVGLGVPILISGVLNLFRIPFSLVSFNIPLFGNSLAEFQSFAAAEIASSMPWKLFNIMFVAGTMETYVYNFGIVIAGIWIGIYLYNQIYINKRSDAFKRFFVFAISFIITTVFFVVSHILNASYGPSQFIGAAIFLIIANISIYLGGLFFMFWVGFHQSNNLVYLVQRFGLGEVAAGFISWFGIIFAALFFINLITVLLNQDKIKSFLPKWWRAG